MTWAESEESYMHMHTRMCVCRRVEPSSSAYRWPTPTPPSSVSRTGATAAPTAQRHFATARQQLSAKCRAMQDQAEHDLLQCDSSALLHRWGHQHQHTRAHGVDSFTRTPRFLACPRRCSHGHFNFDALSLVIFLPIPRQWVGCLCNSYTYMYRRSKVASIRVY